MSMTDTPARVTLVARARGIILNPTVEWRSIGAETTTVAQLFTGYACILLAIPAVATLLQLMLFGHASLLATIVISVLSYALSLLGVLVQGGIFNVLAPSFGGQKNFVQAMKLAIYPQTAVCVAGILDIVPALGIVVAAAGIYGLYILWLGLPRLMKVPGEKAVGYVAVSLISALVVNIGMAVLVVVITRAVIVAMAMH
jgi:hypothetical protein